MSWNTHVYCNPSSVQRIDDASEISGYYDYVTRVKRQLVLLLCECMTEGDSEKLGASLCGIIGKSMMQPVHQVAIPSTVSVKTLPPINHAESVTF